MVHLGFVKISCRVLLKIPKCLGNQLQHILCSQQHGLLRWYKSCTTKYVLNYHKSYVLFLLFNLLWFWYTRSGRKSIIISITTCLAMSTLWDQIINRPGAARSFKQNFKKDLCSGKGPEALRVSSLLSC